LKKKLAIDLQEDTTVKIRGYALRYATNFLTNLPSGYALGYASGNFKKKFTPQAMLGAMPPAKFSLRLRQILKNIYPQAMLGATPPAKFS
ncbi:hypothetical protein T09_10672, partial [Trichinella sp. T9]